MPLNIIIKGQITSVWYNGFSLNLVFPIPGCTCECIPSFNELKQLDSEISEWSDGMMERWMDNAISIFPFQLRRRGIIRALYILCTYNWYVFVNFIRLLVYRNMSFLQKKNNIRDLTLNAGKWSICYKYRAKLCQMHSQFYPTH